ncbi:type II secretion system protein N [Thauera aromatica]|uniref:type II secretion system protein N n=1 Tax=Thauera aromatica TaxID=59405 RepID=UPI001FFC4536|nr:type II secretion system protein N [Thauera aromatica]MCK2094560.1 type II secretion system protein N [Thauera aromatica]
MKARLLQLTLLVLLAGLCGIAVMPARWIIAALPDTGLLMVADADGSLWSGSATLAIGRPELRRSIPEPLRWELVLAGGPHLVASHPWLAGEVELAPAWRGLRVSSQTLRMPASTLTTLHATLGSLDPAGELLLSWPEQVIGAGTPEPGSPLLDLRWNSAASALSPVRPLGAYRVLFSQGDAERIDIGLTTLISPLLLQGQGTWSADQGLRFEGRAQVDAAATPDTRIALEPLLNILGPRQGDHTRLSFH